MLDSLRQISNTSNRHGRIYNVKRSKRRLTRGTFLHLRQNGGNNCLEGELSMNFFRLSFLTQRPFRGNDDFNFVRSTSNLSLLTMSIRVSVTLKKGDHMFQAITFRKR